MKSTLRLAVSRNQLSIVFDGVRRQDWQKQGACVNLDPHIFDEACQGKLAREVCARCPVTRECLKFALTGPIAPHGTFGSVTFPDQRGREYNAVRASAFEVLRAMEKSA
jgi:hypothetical protein